MNVTSKKVFLIGPGGVGKSTVGRILAKTINFKFVDIDIEYCNRIKPIGDYIHQYGYRKYCETNSELFRVLLSENSNKTVFPLSSGFLVHEDSPELVNNHKKLLYAEGVSILLLPTKNLKKASQVIIPRLLARPYMDTTWEKEEINLSKRFYRYLECGDIKIFSNRQPEQIVSKLLPKLKQINVI